MKFYKIHIHYPDDDLDNVSIDKYYSNLKLLCATHGLSYRSAYDKIRTRKEVYQKDNMIVSECFMIMGTRKSK